ncbi:hypothetical protein [Amycolatopsis iheyensis]|nr:hypothetical protein [Amycolatopsis iheyensis]
MPPGELADRGSWTEAAARAYADVVGAAMVGPILSALRTGHGLL